MVYLMSGQVKMNEVNSKIKFKKQVASHMPAILVHFGKTKSQVSIVNDVSRDRER